MSEKLEDIGTILTEIIWSNTQIFRSKSMDVHGKPYYFLANPQKNWVSQTIKKGHYEKNLQRLFKYLWETKGYTKLLLCNLFDKGPECSFAISNSSTVSDADVHISDQSMQYSFSNMKKPMGLPPYYLDEEHVNVTSN